ncbi:MAG TPA: hypothetical protein VGX78_07840, partial [Pirellulales bacterium]|nr:hypothetical protein [Pirellulales bacterium]
MKEGNLDTADSLIGRAENIPVTFGMMHMGDTPKKARRDLARMRSGQAPKKPSDLFAPEGKEAPAKQTNSVRDPFAPGAGGFEPKMDRPPADTGMATDPRSGDTPPTDEAPTGLLDNRPFPNESPFGKQTMTAPPTDDRREPGLPTVSRAPATQTADELLREESGKLLYTARRALAVGDVRRATELVNQAKGLDLQYDFREDSPAKVDAAIQHYAQLAQGGTPDSEAYRRRKAECFLEQAEGLLAWNDFDEAERLVDGASRLNVVYGPADARPDMLRERITSARRGGAGRVEPLPPVEQVASPAARQPAPPVGPDAQQKEQVLKLVAQAEAALASGDLDRAEEIAAQAENLGVPDATFGRYDEKPWEVLLKIQRLRKEQRKVKQVGSVTPIGTNEKNGATASQALYNRDNDRTRNVPAAAQDAVDPTGGMDLYQRGEQALRDHDREAALGWFRQANLHRDELDPVTQQHLQDHLQFLARPQDVARRPGSDGSLLADTAATQQLKYRQVAAELSRKEQSAA